MAEDTPTVIDARADFEGRLTGKDVQVRGKFRGEIEIAGRLTVADGAVVDARVKADAAEIGGEFKGELAVRALVVLEKGRVSGTIAAQTFSVREGAQLNGAINAGAERAKTAPRTT